MSATNIIADIKAKIDIVDVVSRYCELVGNGTRLQARTNPIREEKTSSFFVFKNSQKWTDFGSAKSGDVIDFLMEAERLDKAGAIRRAEELAGDVSILPAKAAWTPKQEEPAVTHEQLKAEFENFERLTFSNPDHKAELLEICPEWLYKTADPQDVAFFQSLTRYDAKNKTLVAAWMDTTGFPDSKMVTYKRRRFNGGKWINRKDTHPNSVPFVRVYDDYADVLMVEGMRDVLVATLLGLHFIGIPTASFKNVDAIVKEVGIRDRVTALVEDAQSYTAMEKIIGSIPAESKRLITFVENESQKVDLADLVCTKSSIDEVKHELFGTR